MENVKPLDDINNGNKLVPYSTSVLVLGILSIVLCFCYGIGGIVCGIIAIVQSSRGKREYEANPSAYREGSYKNLKAGRICAIVGLCLSTVYLVYVIVIFSVFGAALTQLPWDEILKK